LLGIGEVLGDLFAHEKPMDRHWPHAAGIPESRAAGDLDETVGSAAPETDAIAPPNDFAILDERGQLQGLTLDWRSTTVFAPLRREGTPSKLAKVELKAEISGARF